VVDNFEMEMRSGRASSTADSADDVAALHEVAGLDAHGRKMRVSGLTPAPVLDHNHVPIPAVDARERHTAIASRMDVSAIGQPDLDAAVKCRQARHRIAAPAVPGTDGTRYRSIVGQAFRLA